MKPNIFQRAASLARLLIHKKKNEGMILPVKPKKIQKLIDQYVKTKKQLDALERQRLALRNDIITWVRPQYFGAFLDERKAPGSLTLIGSVPQCSVQFITQNRMGLYNIDDKTRDQLITLIGEENTNAHLVEEIEFGFDQTTLRLPGVMRELGKCIEGMVKQGTLTPAQSDNLITARAKRVLDKSFFDDLPAMCGDVQKMMSVGEVVGGNITQYLI